MLVQNEQGHWIFDWPLRTEDPEEERELRNSWVSAFTPERINMISPWSFSYPTRILRKEGTDG